MFTRNLTIIVAAVAATSLAVIVGNIAGRKVRDPDVYLRAVIGMPPRDAPPLGKPPPVEEQPIISDIPSNPFAGRNLQGQLVLKEANQEKLKELLAGNEQMEYIRDGAYLLAWAIPVLAAFLLWCRWRRQRYLDLMEKEIELELVRQGGTDHEPSADSRPCTPDGPGDSGDGQGLPDGTRTPGSLSDLLRDLQSGTREVRDGAGEDAASPPANE